MRAPSVRRRSGVDDGSDLSRRARAIEISPTVAMAQRAAALKARGERVLDFSVGEPDQATPAHVVAAAKAALDAGRTRYTGSAGIPELRAAVAARYRADFGLRFAPEEVAVTTGGKHALYLACQALLDPGDEVLVPAPYWPTFAEAVRLAGGRPRPVATREAEGFRVSARLLERALGPRTRALVVNSPSNPTGAVIEPGELEQLGRLARRKRLTLLYDDTYAHISFRPAPKAVLARLREAIPERFVVLGTASKSYCMTGWRIGWILGPRALVDACTALVSHSTQCPAAFAQVGAVEALTGPQDFVRALALEYKQRRDFVHGRLKSIPGLGCVRPEGAFYAFPNVTSYLGAAARSSLALASLLLDEAKVAVVPGEGFAAPGYLRLSFARSQAELAEGLDRIAATLARLRAG
jgi:aspartate aminotransferase